MKNVSKKVISMFLVTLMALSCMGITAFAADAPAAPAGFAFLKVFSDTIVIDGMEGCEYAAVPYAEDGTFDEAAAEFKPETIISGLTAETDYAVLGRFAATDTAIASEYVVRDVTTGKVNEDPIPSVDPAKITVDHNIKNIVCAPDVYTYGEVDYTVKYEINPAANVDVSSLADGSMKFGNLTSGSTYQITANITIEGVTFTSTAYDVTLKTAQNAPTTPVPVQVTDTSIEIQKIDNEAVYAIALKGAAEEDFVYGPETKFENLTANTTYVIKAMYNETATSIASPASYIELVTKSGSKGTAPAPVLLDKSNTTIKVGAGLVPKVDENGNVLKDSNGNTIYVTTTLPCEFSIDGGATWDSDGLFTGLQANKKYEIVARYVYDAANEAPSVVSAPVSIFTNTRENYEATLDKCTFTLPADEINAKESFIVKADGDMYDETAQYGDTRLVVYSISYGETVIYNTSTGTGLSATFEAPATSQDITVVVKYRVQKCVQVNEDGSSYWAWATDLNGNIIEKETRNTVHIAEEYNAVKAFFVGILNFLLNTLPAFILSLFN